MRTRSVIREFESVALAQEVSLSAAEKTLGDLTGPKGSSDGRRGAFFSIGLADILAIDPGRRIVLFSEIVVIFVDAIADTVRPLGSKIPCVLSRCGRRKHPT